jgi:hypothetical protein
MARKDKHDTKAATTAHASEQAAKAAGQENPAAGAGSQGPASDSTPPTEAAGAAEHAAAPDRASAPGEVVTERVGERPVDFVTLSFPLPDSVPAEALKHASIVVKAKSQHGRRRAGYAFTREETVIPYLDLDAMKLGALVEDAELVVAIRIPKPAG